MRDARDRSPPPGASGASEVFTQCKSYALRPDWVMEDRDEARRRGALEELRVHSLKS